MVYKVFHRCMECNIILRGSLWMVRRGRDYEVMCLHSSEPIEISSSSALKTRRDLRVMHFSSSRAKPLRINIVQEFSSSRAKLSQFSAGCDFSSSRAKPF